MNPDSALIPMPDDPPPRVFGDRFREERTLKQGHSMETLYGLDVTNGEAVVIKAVVADRISPAARMRLEHEAEVLRKIDSPLLVPLLAVGQHDGLFFMVTRYQAGTTLEALLRQRRLTVDETLTVARCVLAALAEAHRHRVLHRDIKTANVILDQTDPVGRAVLVDFGLAHSSQLDVGVSEPSLNSVRYVSPEQAGMLDAEVAPYSDLYSTGVVLYECLAGRTPFDGRSIGEVLRQHMTLPPAELRSFGLEIPHAVDAIVQRLLRKDPRDRYQTAAAVLADIEALSGQLQSGQSDPALVIGLHDQRQTLTEPAFVGREQELAALDGQVRRARGGRGGLVLVEAESGGGKTRLLGELSQRWARQAVWVLRGQAQDQVGQHPFLALEGIADEILTACRDDPKLAGEIREGLGDRLDAVVAVLPRLTEVLGGSPSQVLGPESFGEARTIEALVTFLAALGSENRPALIILDDCQWADEPTLKLLRRAQSRRKIDRHTPSYAVLICAFRSEEVREGHILRSLSPSLQLRLPPFGEEDTRRLAESMAGSLPSEAMDFIIGLSDGSPFMASAVLRGMVESRALLPEPSGWRVERAAMDDVRSSRHAAELLARRIKLLPRVAVDLLKVAAVLGKEFELNLAANLAGLLPGHALLALKQAQNRHLVWTRPGDEKCVFIHDKVRETCLTLLGDDERRDLHVRAASLLQQRFPPPNFDLAYHYDMAGQNERAQPYALAAAEQARGQYSLEIAEQQYRIALRGAATANQATCYRIAEGLGDVLMLRGRYDPARQMFEAAKFLAEGDVGAVKAKIEGKLGELAFKRGDMQSAAQSLERGLRHLGRRIPRRAGEFLLRLVWEVFVQALHTQMPAFFLRRVSLQGSEKSLLAARLYSRLGHAYWFARGKIPTLWAHLREMNLTERYPPTLELAQAYSEHAPAMSLIARFDRGITYAEQSLKIRRELGDVWGQAQSLHYLGIVLYASSRFEECIDKCREAVRLFERTGDFWEMNMARYQIAASLYRLGNLGEAEAEAKRLHKSGVELGDVQASGISLDVWAWSTDGKVPAEELKVELERTREDAQATAQVLVAEGVRRLHAGEAEAAAEALEKARRAVLAKGVRNAWVAPVWPWLATALRQQVESLTPFAAHRREALLCHAERVLNEALRVTRKFRNDLPHAWREKALVLAMRGRESASRRCFDRSLTEADWQGARHERAQTLLYRGRVGCEFGWGDANRDVADGEHLLAELRGGLEPDDDDSSDSALTPATLSLVDRFDAVLEAGRKIASSLNRDAVFLAVREAALRLLRGEECAIWSSPSSAATASLPDAKGSRGDDLDRDDEGLHRLPSSSAVRMAEVVLPAEHPGPPGLQVLAERALRTPRTVVYSDSAEEFHNLHLAFTGIRSALCTPIFFRGVPIACFCVWHRQITELFGEDEGRLAGFIATLAGAALENAAGFEELQQLNLTLEQRVAERTADLEARTEELARSNSELEQFAYVASHDLQEPLRTVTGYCRLLESQCPDSANPKAHEYIAHAVEASQRMKTLINDLLTYSRVGRKGKSLAPLDFAAVLDQALANLSMVIEETQTVIHRGPMPRVLGDATPLLQLIQNLIDNGIKFRGSERPQITVTAELQGEEWRFCVRDNGIGIPPEHQDRVFKIFQRLHPREKYPGTGIGLAVCKKTVEHHGGRIWVESELGQGCAFYFTLPAVPDQIAPPEDM